MNGQAVERAYLEPLPRCWCGKAATKRLVNGVNAPQGVFCDPHANAAQFKERA